jgi:ABC-type lipoprotein release transport system permease subunit
VEIFLFESVLLGLVGGIVGGVVGYGAALANFAATVGARYLTKEMAAASMLNILVCVGISAGLALVASVIPVLMAAKVEPAAAMRYEV